MGAFNKKEKEKVEDLYQRSWSDRDFISFQIKYDRARIKNRFSKDDDGLCFDYNTFMVQNDVATKTKHGLLTLKGSKLMEFRQFDIQINAFKIWSRNKEEQKDIGSLGIISKKDKNEEITA